MKIIHLIKVVFTFNAMVIGYKCGYISEIHFLFNQQTHQP